LKHRFQSIEVAARLLARDIAARQHATLDQEIRDTAALLPGITRPHRAPLLGGCDFARVDVSGDIKSACTI